MDRVEIIVPFDEKDRDIPQMISGYPDIMFHTRTMSVEGSARLRHEHFDELRAAGLNLAWEILWHSWWIMKYQLQTGVKHDGGTHCSTPLSVVQ